VTKPVRRQMAGFRELQPRPKIQWAST